MNDSTVEKSMLGIGSYEPGTWLTDQEQAFEYAAQSGKIVFFIGDYATCPYAKKMWSELLTQPDFLEYAKENFILLHVTTAISPVVRLFDPQGVEITQRLGFDSGHSDIWLQWLKIPYAQITGVLVDSGTSSFANKANLWQNDTVKANESAFVACNGVISNIEILGEGFLEVHSGGIAKNTTVQNLAEMFVINGVARETTANSGGHIYVHHSGKLEDSLINRGGAAFLWKDGIAECTSVEGDLIVESGGSAISTFVNSNGYIHISSGGTAVATTNSGLGYVFNGGSACQTKLDDNSMLFVMQGGKTMQTEVNASAMEYISSGGYAEQTCVNVGGTLLVEGGSAVMIKENGGWVSFFSDANVSFQQNIFSGVNLSKTGATVHSGTIARNTRINAAGSMHVFSGGLADCTVVNSGILSISSGGTASGTLLNYDGTMSVFAGGLAVGTEMTGIAKISGNIKDSVISNGGLMQIQSGGCAEDTKVFSGGIMYISSGAVHRGYLDLESSVRVSAYTGAIIDFTLSNRKSSDEYLINNFALIAGTPTYTITVSADQAEGTYKLAQGAENFTNTISIGNGMITYGSITVNGTKLQYNGTDYTLTQTNGDLLLNVQETIVPTVFIYSNGTLTSSGTTITGARVSGAYNSMHISNCGVANSTTVFDSGCVLVFSGGTANNTTIYSNCTMTLSSGGLANSTTVNSQGRLYISSGGMANYTMITGDLWYGLGSMTVLKGGMAKNTTVGGFMFISSGGTADSTTVISGGIMCISSGGTADSTTVISGGSMHISSGGTATNIIASNGARLWITVVSNTYIQGTANGSAFEMKNAQISGYGINSWGTLEVYSGGTADSTTINSGGVLIYNGGVASNTTVNSGGYISLSGGIHRGTLQIASGATVSAHIYTGGTIDFTVSDRTTEDGYLINDLSLISGTPTYTITVSADQAFGTYKLAQGAENFTNTISIGNGMITYGSITVNGDDLVYDDFTYSLDQVDGNLTLTIAEVDLIPPEKPIAIPSTTEITNKDVTVSVTYSADSIVKQYKIGENGEWVDYTRSFAVRNNDTIYFRAEDAAGNESTSSLAVTNIDKVAPTLELTADITTPTNGNVVLTATVSDGTVEYFADGKWNTGDSLTVSTNGTYQFRVTDVAGNVTSKSFEVTNIDKVAPTLTISGNPTSWTNLDVMLSASSNEEVTFQYSFDNFEWHSGAQVTLSANSSVYFKATDKAGNVTTQSVDVTKIDKTLPGLTISGNPAAWTNQNVVLSAASNEEDTLIEYSFDGKTWHAGSSVTMEENGTVHFKATDKAGNVTTQSVDVTKIDKTLPGLTVSGNPENWTNKDVTLSAASNEGDTIIEYSFDGKAWHSGSEVTVSENKTIHFRATDKAGNVTTQRVDVNKIDKVLPGLTVTGNVENWTNQDVTLAAASNEDDTLIEYSFDGTRWEKGSTVVVTENRNVYFKATDKAGNVTTQKVDVTKIDKVLPALTVTGTPENWTSKDVTLNAASSEEGVSFEYSFDGEIWHAGSSVTVKENGTLHFRATDKAGNVTTQRVDVTKIDKILPDLTVTGNAENWTNQDVTLNASSNEGDTLIEYSFDGKAWHSGSEVTVSENKTIHFKATDKAGNVTTQKVDVTKIDKILPGLTVTGNPENWTNQDVTLSAASSETGVAFEYSFDGKAWYSGSEVTVSENETIHFRATDKAGNVTTQSVDVNKIDKTLPGLTVSGNPENWTNQDVTLNASSNESDTLIEYSFDGKAWHSGSEVTVSENKTIHFKATDKAGNVTTQSVDVNKIDKALPDLTISGNPENWTNQDVTLSASSSEENVAFEYSFDGKAWYSSSEVTVDENTIVRFRATDKAGNVTVQNIEVSKIDKTLPDLTVTGNPVNWTSSSVFLKAASSEENVAFEYSFDGKTWHAGSSVTVEENKTIHFKVTDKGGNVTTQSVDVTKIDKTLPGLIITGNPENWTNQDVTLSAASNEEETAFEYSFDGKVWHGGSEVTVDENISVHFRVTDKAGNVTTQKVDVNQIDKTLPDLTISGNTENWTSKDVTLNAASSEAEVVFEYSFDGKSWFSGSSVTVKENGTLHFRATDKGGNVTTQSVDVTKIDKVLPDLTVTGNAENWTNKDVTLNAASNEEDTLIEYSFDGKAWYVGSEVTAAENKTIHFRATDKAGNVTTQSVDVNKIDKTAPSLTFWGNPLQWTNKSVILSASSNEEGVVEYSFDGKTWYTGSAVVVQENRSIYFRTTDKAGNVTTQSVDVTKIDKTAPEAPAQFTVSTGRDSVFINWEDVSDGKGSGVKSFQFRYGKSSELSGEGLSCSASEIRLADLTGGTWYYQVRTRDKAGNSSGWSELRSFTLTGNAPQMLTGSAAGVSWQEMPGTGRYIVEYSTDNFNSAASFTTDAAGVDTFALPEAPYLWRVRSANSQEWAYGEEISGVPAAAPEKVISDNDGMADLFFARSTEQWSTAYEACHFGNALWGGTLEKVSLAGKNRIADLFEGSADANVLLLTDDEEGDALFVDDIYTALGDQARFSQIHEIRSGAGDDIVDMTSQRYDYEGSGVKISGGSGNDTIWASRGSNILFGDEGDDRLIGGKDNDLLSGGSGNDRMHGGGGEDIFTFGGDWGNDSVEQLAGGSVTLWFEEGSESNWNADTLTYTDGANSVTVKGAVSVTLKFGADAELPEGAFSTSVSRKIFEELSFQA